GGSWSPKHTRPLPQAVLTRASPLCAAGGEWSPQRLQAFAARGLQQAHRAHVAVAEEKEREKRERAPQTHVHGVEHGEQEVNGETEFKQWQEATLAPLLLHLPRRVRCLFDAILGRADEVRLDAE